MSNIIPFQPNADMPALFQEMFGMGISDDLSANVGLGYPYMSFKGKTFKIIDGSEEEVITNAFVTANPAPGTEDMPAQFIQVVLLYASRDMSKTYYMKGYTDDAHEKPDCSSFNGVKPDPGVPAPQSQACATCRWNEWGSRPVTADGMESKGKACQDARRVAIAFPNALDDPMLLRIPPTSLKGLAEYGATLAKKGVPYQAVVTSIWFNKDFSHPVMMFKPARYVTKDEAQAIMQLIGAPSKGIAPDPIINAICAIQSNGSAQPEPSSVAAHAAAARNTVQTPAPVPSPAAQTVAAAPPQPDIPSGMFDTPQQAAPAPTPAPAPSPAASEPPATATAPKRRRTGKAATAAQPTSPEQPPGVVPNGAAHAGVTVVDGSVASGVDALLGGLPDVPGI